MRIEVNATPIVKDGHELLRITSDILIISKAGQDGYKRKAVKALWDTGATNTSIPMETATAMGIQLGDECPVTAGTAVSRSNFCKFFLQFPSGEVVPVRDGMAVPGMRAPLVIGMDIIGKGVSSIVPDGNGGVRFSFEIR